MIEELTDSQETKPLPIGAPAELIFEAKLKGGKRAELRIHREGSRFIGMLCSSGWCGIVLYSDSPLDKWNIAETAVSILEETYKDKLKRIVLVENDEDDELDRDPDIEIKVADDDG